MEEESKIFYVGRSFALLSIVLAHSYVYTNLEILKSLLNRITCIGVPFFLFSSGFYFDYQKGKFIKRLYKILLPWFILGSLVTLFEIRQSFSFRIFINAIFGINSIYYYLTVLVLILSLYSCIRKFVKSVVGLNAIDISLIVITQICVILTALDVLPYRVDTEGIVFISAYSCYLNVFCWIGFFSLGQLFKRNKNMCLKRGEKGGRYSSIIIISGWVLFTLVVDCFDIYHSYFSVFSYLIEIWGIIGILLISNSIVMHTKRLSGILSGIGKLTFFTYLVHLPLVSISRRIEIPLLGIIVPVLVIILLYFCQLLLLKVFNLNTEKSKIARLFLICLGISPQSNGRMVSIASQKV